MGADPSNISPITPYNSSGVEITTGQVGVASSANVNEPVANTAAVLTYVAVATLKHVIRGVAWSYDGAPTGGNLKIEDVSGTTVFSIDIIAGGPDLIPVQLKANAVNTAMIITLAAGGGGIVGKVNVLEHWTEA